MNEPHDPRPLQTVNRLRLVVFIPVLVAVVGVLLLGSKLALKFREIEEPPARGIIRPALIRQQAHRADRSRRAALRVR